MLKNLDYKLIIVIIFVLCILGLALYFLSDRFAPKNVKISTPNNINHINTEELLLFYNNEWKHQYIYDLSAKQEVEIKNLRYQSITKDKDGHYWVASEGITDKDRSKLDRYNSKGKLTQSIDQQKDVPLVLKNDGEFIYYAVLTMNSISKIKVYSVMGQLIDQIPLDYYVWDLTIESNIIYIAAHELNQDLGKLLIYDLDRKKLTEIDLLSDYAPVSITYDHNAIYLGNYHKEDGVAGVISIYDKGRGFVEHLEVPTSPGNLYVQNNELYVFHYIMSLNAGDTLSKIHLESERVEVFEIPVSQKVIYEEDYIYLIQGDSNTILKMDYYLNLLDEYKLEIKDHVVINLGR